MTALARMQAFCSCSDGLTCFSTISPHSRHQPRFAVSNLCQAHPNPGNLMMKTLLTIAIFGMTTSSNAETLSFPSFRIEVENDWVYSLERGFQAHHATGEMISIYHPNGNGILKIQAYSAPDFVSKEILRNMTNVDLSTPLTWRNWGDYSGYQYDYLERGSFYRQWWLVNERIIIFIVYDSNTESRDIEIDETNKIVNSITVNKP